MHVKPDVERFAKIRVIGVGGAGCNVLNYLIDSKDIDGVEFIAVNTDAQALNNSKALTKVELGNDTTSGLGAGSIPDVGKKAAEESRETIKSYIEGADMIFVTAGMGGGTGTGAAPVIAGIARELGALTIGVVTRPFNFEGNKRRKNAEYGLTELSKNVDALITIPNQRLIDNAEEELELKDAFKQSDSVLSQGVQGIADLIIQPGLINVDFADVRTIMKDAGTALMGIGYGTGEHRAEEAARAAIESPLLDESIEGATGVLFNITGATNLTMKEVDKASKIISELVSEDANIIFGTTVDENLGETLKITVIATGFESNVVIKDTINQMKDNLNKQTQEVEEPDNLSLLIESRSNNLSSQTEEIDDTAKISTQEDTINVNTNDFSFEEKNENNSKGILNFNINKESSSKIEVSNSDKDVNFIKNENSKLQNNDNNSFQENNSSTDDLNSDYDKSFDIPAFLRNFKKK